MMDTSSTSTGQRFRPPDFLLPNAENSAARRRNGEPDIFVSWGGEVYGPTGPDDILAGLKAAWFEPDAAFWFEGQSAWLPVKDFAEIYQLAKPPTPPASDSVSETKLPQLADQPRSSSRRKRRRGARHSTDAKSPRRLWIVIGFIALAGIATVGILWLLTLI
jgi:hypothetical protein